MGKGRFRRVDSARRWARAWKKEAKHCLGALEIMDEWATDDGARIAELERALRAAIRDGVVAHRTLAECQRNLYVMRKRSVLKHL